MHSNAEGDGDTRGRDATRTMKATKYMIQSTGGLATTLIRQKLTDEILQYKPQDKQTRSSTLPVHADWTAKDVAWTRLST
jgi:hypothetical protein